MDRTEASAAKARKNDPFAKWASAKARFDGAFDVAVTPSFQLETGCSIFTIGSCFARNIEQRLDAAGFDIPMLGFDVPKAEYPGLQRGIMNKYTPPSIFQELAWTEAVMTAGGTANEQNCEVMAYRLNDGPDQDGPGPKVIDLNLGGFVPVSWQRFIERRQQLYDVMVRVFTSDVVTITLGLTEAWFDTTAGSYVQQAPIGRNFVRNEDRFAFEQLRAQTCFETVYDAIALVQRHNAHANIILTVSPVPLGRTFTGQDVITANMQSKSVLRGVAGEICNRMKRVDCFPSFELVTQNPAPGMWAEDRRHVSEAAIDMVAAKLLAAYSAKSELD